MNKGEMYSDAAVLYRSNAQSRALEEALLRSSILTEYMAAKDSMKEWKSKMLLLI